MSLDDLVLFGALVVLAWIWRQQDLRIDELMELLRRAHRAMNAADQELQEARHNLQQTRDQLDQLVEAVDVLKHQKGAPT